ncbi:hypothetical protein [Piscirickettsia salmonis]|uniref:hypothetical protein n=3 Tax=Piscirickettsia salmonis TaxID=1238 RepID=UPI0012B8E97E|nr:hypothetical protein [Piscirickettsia salmonis]
MLTEDSSYELSHFKGGLPNLPEEKCAKVLRELLERINSVSRSATDETLDLGKKIEETLRKFYGLSISDVYPIGLLVQGRLYSYSLEAYKSREKYLDFPSSQLTNFDLVNMFTDTHQKATKQELMRRIETGGIDKTSAESAKDILALHSNVMSTGETSSTTESLRNPLVFTQLYTTHDNPEILDMNQRQLVDEFNQTKGNEQLSTEDKFHALKKLKYALVDLIARSGKLEDDVTLQEVNQVIDHRRGHFALTTNTRDYVSEHPRLKQILPAPKMFERLFQQVAEAEAQEQSSTLTPEGESGQTLC